MKKESIFGSFIEKLRDNRKLEIAVYAALILTAAVIFVLSGGISCEGKERSETPEAVEIQQPRDPEETLEARLERILGGISGAGRVRVMVTFETETASSGETGAASGGSSSLTGSYLFPSQGTAREETSRASQRVRGVIVVAEGAEDISVKLALQNAVMTVLGIDPKAIGVFPMGK
ncbi:MAG: hypothetical protein K6G56_08760 [Clostridiales bacterium]|nr:hypothetical protein [Clostridiales bacterium]